MTAQNVSPLLFSDLLFRAILSGQGRDYKMRRSLQTGMSLRVGEEEREGRWVGGGGTREGRRDVTGLCFQNNANVTVVHAARGWGMRRSFTHIQLFFFSFLSLRCSLTMLFSCVISQNKHLRCLQPRLSVRPGRLHPVSRKGRIFCLYAGVFQETIEAPGRRTPLTPPHSPLMTLKLTPSTIFTC